jgi:ABC-type multidrug transport system fused ATPase/permease subunit
MKQQIISPWSRLISLLKLDKSDVSLLYIYAIFRGLVSLSLPLGIQSVIHFIQAGEITTSWIVSIILVIIGVLLSGVLQILQLRITENIQQKIYVRYAFDFAFRFPRFDRKLLDKLVPSELMNRFFDIINLQKGISKVLLDFSAAILQILFSLFVLSFYHPFYIIFSIGLVITLIFLFKPIINRGFNTSLIESKYKYKTAYWLQEIAKTDWSFRLNPVGNHHLKKLDDLTQGYLSSREEHFKILWLQFSWMIAFKVIIVTSLLGIGGYLVIDQQMNLGQFVAAEVLIVLILGAFEKIIQLLDTLYDVFTSLEKIEQVRDIQMLNEEVNLKEDFDSSNFYPIELTAGNDSNRVILSLLKRDRVHVISTSDTETIQQLKSIIDPTISSKYIPRWNHEVPSNEKTKLAFCKIGWFSKQTHLFEGTIKENILMGRTQINNDELNEILNLLNIKDAIASQSEGINTIMTRGSFIFNDAQKEKILIARALIGNPEVLILSFLGSCMNNEEITQLIVNIDNYLIDSTIIASGNFNTPINWQTKQL